MVGGGAELAIILFSSSDAASPRFRIRLEAAADLPASWPGVDLEDQRALHMILTDTVGRGQRRIQRYRPGRSRSGSSCRQTDRRAVSFSDRSAESK